jgi:hypothetical protein
VKYERPCDLCRVNTLVAFLEPTTAFPYKHVCEGCAEKLALEDADEPSGPSCECGDSGCPRCLAVRGWL